MAEGKVVRRTGEGDALWLLGGLYEVKAAGGETGGAATVMEMTLPPGLGPPPHRHPGGEAVYVLEGTLRYHVEGETFDGAAGDFFYLPQGTLENFEPTGDTPLRILVIYTPGGIDRFFHEAGEPAQARELPPPPDSPPDVERLVEIGGRYGMEIAPPG
jgi:quercetin dioxygenase-like cupin family protein